MFVYVEDRHGQTHLLHTDHIIKCVQRKERDYWNVHMTDGTHVNLDNEAYKSLTEAMRELIGG